MPKQTVQAQVLKSKVKSQGDNTQSDDKKKVFRHYKEKSDKNLHDLICLLFR